MAKLDVQSKPGYNVSQNIIAKPFRVADIVIDPEISQIFKIHDKTLEEITQKIEKFGYDKSQPVVVWKGTNIILDGHTRLAAAKEAGLEEIPTVEMEFEDRESAIMYTFERQVVRRNLTGPEILKAAEMIPDERQKKGEGRAAEQAAQRLGISPSTVYQARAVLKEAPQEDIEAVKNGDMSIKAAYNKVNASKKAKPGDDFPAHGTGLPASAKFLKPAVTLLAEAGQETACGLLINHFLKKHERDGFFKILPDSVQNGLAILNS